jgi:hypothetical protein
LNRFEERGFEAALYDDSRPDHPSELSDDQFDQFAAVLHDTHVGEIKDSWQDTLNSSHRNIIEVQMGIKSPSSCSLREKAIYKKSKIMYYGRKSPALRYIYTNFVTPRLSRFKRLKPAQNR